MTLSLAVPRRQARLRHGSGADLAQVVALYARCSEESRRRRFHAPLPVVPRRLVLRTLEPDDGWSTLAVLGRRVVGVASAGRLGAGQAEVGVLVDDAHQGRGLGTRLLVEVAAEAIARGYTSLLCLTQPDNVAVRRSIERSGLPTTTRSDEDDLISVTMHLPTQICD